MMQASSMLLLSNVMITTQIQGFLNDHISVESQQWHHYAFSRLMTCPGSQQQAASRQKQEEALLHENGRETDESLNVERMRCRPKFCFRKNFRASPSSFDRTDFDNCDNWQGDDRVTVCSIENRKTYPNISLMLLSSFNLTGLM